METKTRRWHCKVPYKWPGTNKRTVFRFYVDAKHREQAALFAKAIVKEKCPVEPDLEELKMVRA